MKTLEEKINEGFFNRRNKNIKDHVNIYVAANGAMYGVEDTINSIISKYDDYDLYTFWGNYKDKITKVDSFKDINFGNGGRYDMDIQDFQGSEFVERPGLNIVIYQ